MQSLLPASRCRRLSLGAINNVCMAVWQHNNVRGFHKWLDVQSGSAIVRVVRALRQGRPNKYESASTPSDLTSLDIYTNFSVALSSLTNFGTFAI
jgi:hypothetical protein